MVEAKDSQQRDCEFAFKLLDATLKINKGSKIIVETKKRLCLISKSNLLESQFNNCFLEVYNYNNFSECNFNNMI